MAVARCGALSLDGDIFHRVQDGMLESVNCDFCGAGESTAVASQCDRLHRTTSESFTIVRCSSCGLHRTNPRPPAENMGAYYSADYAFHHAPPRLREALRRAAVAAVNGPLGFIADVVPTLGRRLGALVQPKIADFVRLYYAAGGSGDLLDIGCGAGASAHFWGARGSLLAYRHFTNVAGIEFAGEARKTLESLGIVAWADLHEVPPERRFGFIRMNWSLEHMHAPSRYFDFIQARLLDDGRAMIAVPNYDGLIYRLARDCVELPIHLYHFRPIDIENYATRFGLRVVSVRTFSYPRMFTVAAQLEMLPPAFGRPSSVRSAREFQSALSRFDDANLGNDMIAILARDE